MEIGMCRAVTLYIIKMNDMQRSFLHCENGLNYLPNEFILDNKQTAADGAGLTKTSFCLSISFPAVANIIAGRTYTFSISPLWRR